VLLVGSATAAWAQDAATPDMTQRMQELEKQVAELKAALAFDENCASTGSGPCCICGGSHTGSSSTDAHHYHKSAGLDDVERICRRYYGGNFNHPASHTNGSATSTL